MEKDTVLLAVEKYNELRDFKKEVEERLGSMFSGGYSRKYYTESEAVLDFEKRNKELEAKNKELEAKNKELEAKIEKAGIKEPVENSINDLNKMSYWEFCNWCKS